MEGGLYSHLLEKYRTVSSISLGEGREKAKIYYSMSAYVQDNTRSFTKLKLNYFWYLLHFTIFVPLLLLGINVLEKAIESVRRRRLRRKVAKSKRRKFKI